MAISSGTSIPFLPYTPQSFKRTSSVSATVSFSSLNSFCKPLNLVQLNRSNLFNCKKKKKGFTCNCLFGLGVPELVVIAGVAALVFGPKKLPEVGRSIGKTVKSFQQAAKEFETELKKEPGSVADSLEKPAATGTSEKEKEDDAVPSAKESV